ncbi:TPA: hypothetical protein IUX43_002567 [Enterococcus faecalis]|nr:hypothetical protein [Enterococcus faecalis]HAP4749458.1 hypothetical protein [Enterococcus faecalis]HAP4765156.1 hypothetical protein [Enterococcus faecalis]HAP4867603.1 hypothetical protein [Enterococcus faecalis]HAP4879751.1 hypothetical protein [Enterococcus faecalis]
MEELVFLHSQYIKEEPYTTDEVIAFAIGIKRKSVQNLIRKHIDRLRIFGEVDFKMGTPTKKGGRPKKFYLLNKAQATQVIDWTRNLSRKDRKAEKFKDDLIEKLFKVPTN